MTRLFKDALFAGLLLVAGTEASFGFSLAGPPGSEPWQLPVTGYTIPGTLIGFSLGGLAGGIIEPEIVTPKNLGEEYRRNTPVMYYYIDQNFRDYFGSNGVLAVEQAISEFNSLSNVSQYSATLAEVPTQTRRENYRAEALNLLDLKSVTMHFLCEQLGLAQPERWVWTIHDREHFGNIACPIGQVYTVVQRNFDPVPSALNQFQYSSYVNSTLYSYFIEEFCDAPGTPPNALTVPFPVDPLDFAYSTIAGAAFGGIPNGRFFTGLTRDDVGGLRYLLRANNINYESAGTNTLSLITNNAPQLLVTSNLTLLAQQALTNDAPTLSALYPGLAILTSVPFFTNIFTTNITPFFTNFPFDPVGTPARLAFLTNVTVNVATYFQHTFGNLFTTKYTSQGWNLAPLYTIPPPSPGVTVGLLSTTVGFTNNPFLPVGGTNALGTNTAVIRTNTAFQLTKTNDYLGDFVLLPTNLCSVQILFSQLTNVLSFTNQLVSVTNTTATNGLLSFTESIVTFFTNHIFVINPVNCVTNAVGWRQGVEKITWVRIPDNAIDEFTYTLYQPLTNNYTAITYDPTNNVMVPQRSQRLVSTPDLLFSAQDLGGVPGSAVIEAGAMTRNIAFSSSTNLGLAYQGLAGPGTIVLPAPPVLNAFIYNKVGPYYINQFPDSSTLQAESFQIPILIWGSFDGTTNDPVVYPNGTSIANIENLFLIQVLPQTLPTGTLNEPYPTTTFTATGGQAPYVWSLAPGSPALPPGLSFTSDGILSGVPTHEGTFDFVIRLMDASGRVVNYNYSIAINL